MYQIRSKSHVALLCRCLVFTVASLGLVSASLAADNEKLAMVEIPLDEPSSSDGAAEAAGEAGFPPWPERRRMQTQQRERVPPPPPGPYMSTALSGDTVRGPAFGRQAESLDKDTGTQSDFPEMPPIDVFSPDRPWPAMRAADQWKPAKGYHYVAPDQPSVLKPGQAARKSAGQNYPGNYYGPYNRSGFSSRDFNMGSRSYPAPSKTWTGPGSQSGVPSMNMYSAPRNRSYAYPQAAVPRYGPYSQFGSNSSPQAGNLQRQALPPAAR
jgi:hypothetical protein